MSSNCTSTTWSMNCTCGQQQEHRPPFQSTATAEVHSLRTLNHQSSTSFSMSRNVGDNCLQHNLHLRNLHEPIPQGDHMRPHRPCRAEDRSNPANPTNFPTNSIPSSTVWTMRASRCPTTGRNNHVQELPRSVQTADGLRIWAQLHNSPQDKPPMQ